MIHNDIHNDIKQMTKNKDNQKKRKYYNKNDSKSRNSKIFLKNKTCPCRGQMLEKRHMKGRGSDKTRFMKNLFVTL